MAPIQFEASQMACGKAFPVSLTAVLLTLESRCAAQNPAFLPGDAFFHTILNEDLAKAFEGSEPVRIRYIRPDHVDFSFNGKAGYRTLALEHVPEPTREAAGDLYRFLRQRISKLVRFQYDPVDDDWLEFEENGFDLFVYNRDFDFQSHRIGIKYNEQWGAEIANFGYRRHNAEVESFGRDWDDWVAEIRDAAEVTGLTVDLPEAQPQPDRLEYVEEPMTLKADVKLIVCPGNLRRCIREQPGSVLFVVDNDGWRAMRRTKTGWKEISRDELAHVRL